VSRSPSLGLGGFLLGLGVGWYVFTSIELPSNVFAWVIIIAGVGIVASSLISWKRYDVNVGGLVRGAVGGLVLSLIFTTGLGFIGGPVISGDYRAEDVKTHRGALTSDNVYFEIDVFNGHVTVSTWSRAEYSIEMTVRARGVTTAVAERNLEDFSYSFDESRVQGQDRLVLRHGVSPTNTNKYSVSVEAFLPEGATIDLDLETSNGFIQLSDVTGGNVELRTSNGELNLDRLYAETINGRTSNGRIMGEVEAPETTLRTSNGKIDLELPCTVSGDYVLETSNTAIDLLLSSSPGVGYRLDFSTSHGGIDLDLPNLDYSVDQRTRKVAETEGYASKGVQIEIDGSTSNSGVDVNS
jgi:hypothetical protein